MPEVSAVVKEQARALETQIVQRSQKAKTDVSRVWSGAPSHAEQAAVDQEFERMHEEAVSETPEAVAPQGAETQATQKIGDVFSGLAKDVAKAREKVEPSKIETPVSVEKKEAPMGDFMQRVDGLIADFKGENMQPSKLMSRKLVKLMVDASPDKFPGNERVAKFASMLGRLKSVFEGDLKSWVHPQGGSFEHDMAALKSEFGAVGSSAAEAAAPPVEATAAGTAEENAAGAPAPAPAEAAPTPAPQTVETPKAEVHPEADGRAAEKFGEQAEAAFAAGDEEGMKRAVGEIEERLNAQISGREEQLEQLYAIPSNQRTETIQAQIDQLEYANAIDRKKVQQREVQLELIGLQKEKKQVDEEIASIQTELKTYEGQQTENLLAQNAAEGRVLAIPGPDRKQELEGKLAELLKRQEDLGKQIGEKEGLSAELADTILQLSRLMERAKQDQKRSEEDAAKKSSSKKEKTTDMGSGAAPGIEGPSLEKILKPGDQAIKLFSDLIHGDVSGLAKTIENLGEPNGSKGKMKGGKDKDTSAHP
jgi:hypothetical protein